jgi:hypothetical protein
VPLCPPHIPYGLPWHRARDSTVTGRRITALPKARQGKAKITAYVKRSVTREVPTCSMGFEQSLGHVLLYLRDCVMASRWETKHKICRPYNCLLPCKKSKHVPDNITEDRIFFPSSYHKINVTRGSVKKKGEAMYV